MTYPIDSSYLYYTDILGNCKPSSGFSRIIHDFPGRFSPFSVIFFACDGVFARHRKYTSAAPICRRRAAQAAAVAPLVRISSTRTTRFPAICTCFPGEYVYAALCQRAASPCMRSCYRANHRLLRVGTQGRPHRFAASRASKRDRLKPRFHQCPSVVGTKVTRSGFQSG